MKMPSHYSDNLNYGELLSDYETAIEILLSNKDEYDRLKEQLYWAKTWLRLSRAQERLAKK